MQQTKWDTCIVILIIMLSKLSDASTGISITNDNYNLKLTSEFMSTLHSNAIEHLSLSYTNHQMLKSLANTGIEVMILIPNNQLSGIAESITKASEWINKNVKPFIPDTNIKFIAVGNEVLTTNPSGAHILLQAMDNLYTSLVEAELDFHVRISSPQSMEIIQEPFPPSHATFSSSLNAIMYPFLHLLKNTGSSFILNAQPVSSYMLDVIVDAAYHSMEGLNFSGIPVLVIESTPEESHLPVSIYSSAKFDHGPLNGRMMYSVELQSVSHAVNGTLEFCVASTNADLGALSVGLNWACGPSGGANCSAIQPGQPCYVANNLAAVASYAYNDYYQRTQANGGTCNFNNTAVLTPNDPSHGTCIFTGSSGTAGSGSNTGGSNDTNTNSSSGGGSTFPNTNPSYAFGPSSFDNAAYNLQFLNPIYLIFPVILLSCFKI